MPQRLRVSVTGDYAMFSRPEFGSDPVSYDMITPTAAVGLLNSVCWKPSMRWVIHSIAVLKPIRFMTVKTNGLNTRGVEITAAELRDEKPPTAINALERRMQRSSMLLVDVHYVIEAEINLTDHAGPNETVEKYVSIAVRRLLKGQCHRSPNLGWSEHLATIELMKEYHQVTPIPDTRPLGMMPIQVFSPTSKGQRNGPVDVMMFPAIMREGVLQVPMIEDVRR